MAVLPSATKGPSGIPAAPASAGSTTVGRSSPIRHRLLLSLALAPGSTLRELAHAEETCSSVIYSHLQALRRRRLVEHVPLQSRSYRLRPGVVVGGRGYVGYVVPLDLTPKPYGRLVALESGR